jgi:hypothetical protein
MHVIVGHSQVTHLQPITPVSFQKKLQSITFMPSLKIIFNNFLGLVIKGGNIYKSKQDRTKLGSNYLFLLSSP